MNDAALTDDPAWSHRSQEVHAQLQGGLKLLPFQGCEERRPNRVVEHRRDEGADHVAGGMLKSSAAQNAGSIVPFSMRGLRTRSCGCGTGDDIGVHSTSACASRAAPYIFFTRGDGGRGRLQLMVVPRDPPFVAGRPLTGAALAWARELHGGQVRAVDHAPFILHPLEVAALLSGREFDDEVVAAGLLHDAVEDTDAGVEDIRMRFGDRVARIVDELTENPAIHDYRERKAALRAQVAGASADAHAVYAADKVVKARELRAQAARTQRLLGEPDLKRRLEHYQRSLEMLESVAPELPLVRQLAFELWALRALPPRP